MPTKIKLFLGLSVANFLVWLNWQVFQNHAAMPGERIVVVLLVTVGIVVFLQIGWLRWLLASEYLLELLDFAWIAWKPFPFTRLFLFYLPQVLLNVAALYCLFSKEAAAWFAARPERSRTGRVLVTAASVICTLAIALPNIFIVPTALLTSLNSLSSPRPTLPLAASLPQPNDPSAIAAGQLYSKACLNNLGSPDGVKAWAAENKLRVISDTKFLHTFAGDGPKGALWQLSNSEGEFLLSIKAETEGCVIWARTANPSDAEAVFKSTLDQLISSDTDIDVTIEKDELSSTPRGQAHILSYHVWNTKTQTAAICTLIAVEQPGGPYQAMLEVISH